MFKPKPLFYKRMEALLGQEVDLFFESCHEPPPMYVRCNTIKISPSVLLKRLAKLWKVRQLFRRYPEIIKIESKLESGEIGNTREHCLGYYYVQELSSMMPVIALDPLPGERILDLCAAPGSKTTQIAAAMKNIGLIIANDNFIPRIKALHANLQRCGVTNAIITREDGRSLCSKLSKLNFKFDKVIVDVQCSMEGRIRTNPKLLRTWNPKMIRYLSKHQKTMALAGLSCLREDGVFIYSTCTLAPEENEEVIQFLIDRFPLRIEPITLPVRTRPGLTSWYDKQFDERLQKCCRIYPQDNDTEGFFIAKLRKIG